MGTIKQLRWWAYKILPLAYDDSLSYYEVVSKATQKLNEVIDTTNKLPEAISQEVAKQLGGSDTDIYDNLFGGIINAIATKEADEVTFTPSDKQGGEIVWLGDTLYEVVAPMVAGTNYIVGTNIVPVDIDGELEKIKGYICTHNEFFHERAEQEHDTQTYLYWKDKLYRVDADIKVNDIISERVTSDGVTTGQLTLVNTMDEITSHYHEMHEADNNLQTQIDGNDGDIENLQNEDVNLQEQITKNLNDTTRRIDNIVAQAGTDNTEIVDARMGASSFGSHVYTNLGQAMRDQVNALNSNCAIYCTDTAISVNDKVITFPTGFAVVKGITYPISETIIDLTTVETTYDAYLFAIDTTVLPIAIKAVKWSQNNLVAGQYYIGTYYKGAISIIGYNIPFKYPNPLYKTHYAYFDCEDVNTIKFNFTSRILTIGAGYIRTDSGTTPIVSTVTIDLNSVESPEKAYVLITRGTNEGGTIEAKTWSYRASEYEYILGNVYGNHVFINGIPSWMIDYQYGSDELTVPSNFPVKIGHATLGINEYNQVTYNPNTHILHIPTGIFAYGENKGSATPSKGINIDIPENDLANIILYDEKTCKCFVTNWQGAIASQYNYTSLGYVFHNNFYINGMNNNYIIKDNDVLFFGDSITAGTGTTMPYHVWLSILSHHYICKNYGIGSTGYVVTATGNFDTGQGEEGDGTPIQQNGNNNILEIMQGVDTIPRCCISAGTNDWSSSINIDTFKEKVEETLDYALSKTGKIFVMTPIHRQGDTNANGAGHTLSDYSNIIINACQDRGIAYCNGFDVPINPNNATSKSSFAPDGIHPNDAGQQKLARTYLNKFITAMI